MTIKPDASSERVTITVRASAMHPDILSVQDAMRQVLDYFDLLLPEGQGDQNLVWNLSLASTNSPLTVVGEPVSLVPDIDVSIIARAQRALIAEQFRELATGERPSRKLTPNKRETMRRLFKRNMNGIGRTDAIFDATDNPVIITPTIAEIAIRVLSSEEKEFDSFVLEDRVREEVGSIEGLLLDVGTDYNQPALLVKERKTGQDIWCRIAPELKHKISEEARFEDVWDRQRVLVRGRISHDSDGKITRVKAHSVERITPRQMTINDIKDQDFTGGLLATEYLEKLREGDLGK
jgi:hypothetical protein